MELAVIVLIVALWVLGSLVPTGHTLPQEIATLKRRQRLYLPYAKEDLKIIDSLEKIMGKLRLG